MKYKSEKKYFLKYRSYIFQRFFLKVLYRREVCVSKSARLILGGKFASQIRLAVFSLVGGFVYTQVYCVIVSVRFQLQLSFSVAIVSFVLL